MFISHLLSSNCSLSLKFPQFNYNACCVTLYVAQWATPAIPVRWDRSGFLWKWRTMLMKVGVHLGFYLAHGRNCRPGVALWVHCCVGLEEGQCRLVFSFLSNASVSAFAVQKCASVSPPMSAIFTMASCLWIVGHLLREPEIRSYYLLLPTSDLLAK